MDDGGREWRTDGDCSRIPDDRSLENMTARGYSGRKLNRFEKLSVWINKTWGCTEEEIKYAI